MATGDDALAAGYPLVPNVGEEGKVKWGAREINKTRDIAAQIKGLIPIGKSAYRYKAGIKSGTANPVPSDGDDGDIYFKVIG